MWRQPSPPARVGARLLLRDPCPGPDLAGLAAAHPAFTLQRTSSLGPHESFMAFQKSSSKHHGATAGCSTVGTRRGQRHRQWPWGGDVGGQERLRPESCSSHSTGVTEAGKTAPSSSQQWALPPATRTPLYTPPRPYTHSLPPTPPSLHPQQFPHPPIPTCPTLHPHAPPLHPHSPHPYPHHTHTCTHPLPLPHTLPHPHIPYNHILPAPHLIPLYHPISTPTHPQTPIHIHPPLPYTPPCPSFLHTHYLLACTCTQPHTPTHPPPPCWGDVSRSPGR